MDQKKKIIVSAVGLIMIIALVGMFKFMFFNGTNLSDSDERLAILIPEVDKSKLDQSTKKNMYDRQEMDSTSINPILFNTETDKNGFNDEQERLMQDELAKLLQMQRELEEKQRRAANYIPNPVPNYNPNQINEIAQMLSQNLASNIKESLPNRQNFYGAASGADETILDLVPAETVDQGVLVNGSTIAIRLKEAARVENPPITIPKDAIVYGKIIFNSTDRLSIDIVSYKTNKKLYNLNLQVYDFDGREGVHLGNRTWPKIPSKVSKDVFDYAYQRGTQQSTFGGTNNEVNLDEAKDVAVLSAIKEVSAEMFDKRRIKIPRKYHLWINVRSTDPTQSFN